jgi:hypothetical protein
VPSDGCWSRIKLATLTRAFIRLTLSHGASAHVSRPIRTVDAEGEIAPHAGPRHVVQSPGWRAALRLQKEDTVRRLIALLIAVGFALGTLVSAQQETAQQPETHDNDERAMVRFVHASPNAAVEQVLLMSEQEAAGGVAIADFGDVGYGAMSDYIAVPPGNYDITVVLEAVEGEELARVVPAESLNASEGGYYTVTLMGLVIPERAATAGEQEATAAEEETPAESEPADADAEAPEDAGEAEVADPTADPFMAWLRGLTAGDAVEEQGLALRLVVLDDEATQTLEAREMLVRIVHAAPGTEPVALALMRADDPDDVNDNDVNDNDVNDESDNDVNDNDVNDESDNDVDDNDVRDEEHDVEIVQTVSYGEASGYVSLRAGDTLEIRTEDGEAVILDLRGEGLEPGMLHTVFVTGTPVEPVPIDVVVASTPPAEIDDADESDEAVAEPEDVNGEPVAEEEATDEAVAVTDPERDDAAETDQYAMVRFVHAAPNADIDQILLVSGDDAADGITIDVFDTTGYAEMTDYVAVPAGSYEITVVLAATEESEAAATEADVARAVPAETFEASSGAYYTITLMGLMVPERVGEPEEQADATDEGFIAWLEGLFATENDRGELELRVMVLDDEATAALDEDEVRVRVVHAAPGTEPVSLAVREADADGDGFELVQTVGYGEASGYLTVSPDDRLEVRTQDGEAVILDLADQNLEPGMLHTIFVTGTPVEEMPIEALVASTRPVEHEAGDEAHRPGELMAAAAN